MEDGVTGLHDLRQSGALALFRSEARKPTGGGHPRQCALLGARERGSPAPPRMVGGGGGREAERVREQEEGSDGVGGKRKGGEEVGQVVEGSRCRHRQHRRRLHPEEGVRDDVVCNAWVCPSHSHLPPCVTCIRMMGPIWAGP